MSKAKKTDVREVSEVSKGTGMVMTIILALLAALFLVPIIIIFMNSFKSRLFISNVPFQLPNSETFVGLTNYLDGAVKIGFFQAFGWSTFITVFSVVFIVLLTAMTAWYLTRIKTVWTSALYYLFVFSMIVPFQMVMFTMSTMANDLSLNNPVGIIVIYIGFGAGLSVFMFCGFVKSIPLEIEEAAVLDGCGPIQAFFRVVFPMLKPTAITVAILNAMWIWNDYLLPYLILGSERKTIPVAIQYLRGGYGSIDMGAMMAMLVLAIVPIIIFYLSCQKYIIKGVAAGAVKG